MTSRNSGFDFQMFNKEEFDAIPFPDIKKLSDAERPRFKTWRLGCNTTHVPGRRLNELSSGCMAWASMKFR